MKKAGFDDRIISFFTNYLVDRKTNYYWNNFMSLVFNVNVGVGQSSALSPILSALYLSPFIYILEKRLKNLKIPISIISFVNNGLFISQSKSFDILNSCLYCSYNILTNLLEKFSLVVEHSKTEIFHFNRSHGTFNPPPLDLSLLGGNILQPNDTWKYLEFIFNRKLTFHQHVDFYANKLISTIKCMKIISNSNCSINPSQKRLLYRSYILPITLYGFRLWFYKCALIAYHLKALGKMQRRAAIWILGAFKMSPSFGIEAIAGLMPINLHSQKLGERSQLHTCKLPPSHLIRSLIDLQLNSDSGLDVVALDSLTNRQQSLVKGYLVDSANRVNECFPSFNPLNLEFYPGLRVINNFSDYISFNLFNKEKDNKSCTQSLDEMVLEFSSSSSVAIIASDASIKNNIAMSIAHIHTHDKLLIKTIHHAVNVISTEAELFAIRCGINQATHIDNISKIIVVTDSIHAVKRIFDLSVHPFQVQSAAVLSVLCYFFNCHANNTIKFWECPSHLKWYLHNEVDKETKMFIISLLMQKFMRLQQEMRK